MDDKNASQKPAVGSDDQNRSSKTKTKSRRSRAAEASASTDSVVERIDMDAALLEYEAKVTMTQQTADAAQANDISKENSSQAEQDAVTKQKGRHSSLVPTKPGAFSVSTAGISNVRSELCGLEADILAKQSSATSRIIDTSNGTISSTTQAQQDIAVKQLSRNTFDTPSKPGAFSATNRGSNIVGSELGGLEADILAKASVATSRKNSASDNTKISLTQDEQDAAAKQKVRIDSVAQTTKPGAFSTNNNGIDAVGSELRGLEADVLSKQVAASSRVNKMTENNESSLTQGELDNAAKEKSRSSTSTAKPGAFAATSTGSHSVETSLSGFEADILAKQSGFQITKNSNDTPRNRLNQVEEDIAAKQNGKSRFVASAKPGSFSSVNSNVGQKNGGSELLELEADILAKKVASMKPSILTPSDNYKQASANIELSDLNDRIQTKIRDGAVQSTTSVPDGLRDLDDKIHAKIRGDPQLSSTSVPTQLRDLDDRIQSKISKEAPISSFNAMPEVVPLREPTWEIQRIDADAEIKSAQVQRHAGEALQSLRDIENATMIKLKNQLHSENASPRKRVDETDHRSVKDETISSGLMSSGQNQLNGLEFGEYGGDEEDGLAIAVAVEEGDNDTYLPAAVEYDPDAKPPMYRNRRFRMYVCLALTAVIVGTVGAVLGITMTNEEIPQEIPYRTTLGIRENVARIVSNELLDDFTRPYSKALDWIMHVDPLAITPDNPIFFQRYFLAYFYYATSVKKPWDACNPPTAGESDTCEYTYWENRLEDRKKLEEGRRWLSGTDECLWIGVDCDNSFQVRGIEISKSIVASIQESSGKASNISSSLQFTIGGIGMTGKFPEGVFKLPKFQHIIAGYGELEGSLPSLTKNIHIFDVRSNHFTGTIPEQWIETRSLQYIDITSSNLTGIISPTIYKMIDMKTIKLDDNELVGSIPETIGKMPSLLALHISQNKINGTIPTEFGKIPFMWSLLLFGNDLRGTIPSEFGLLVNLQACRLQNNHLTGPIPDEFWNAKLIYELDLSENNLNGTISGRISGLKDLWGLDIHSNQFTGNLPARLPTTSVRVINARDNNFNGTVPAQICDATARGDFDLVEMDCAAPLSGGAPEVDCPSGCCTSCCQSDGNNCEPLE